MVNRNDSSMLRSFTVLTVLSCIAGLMLFHSEANKASERYNDSDAPLLFGTTTTKSRGRLMESQVYSCPDLSADPVEIPGKYDCW